ncbi:MAG: hypothetical protein ABI811_07575 [Acidobacteriota bacterium]
MTYFHHLRSNKFVRVAAPLLLAALIAAVPAMPQGKGKGGGDNDPDRAVTNGGLPAGWAVRPDRGTPDQEKVTEAGGLFHFVMGPAGTFYNNAWTKTGNFKYSARVTQTKAASHATSYGIMLGGKGLGTPTQTYTYFLVRQAGEYFVSNWEGAGPAQVIGWTAHPAIQKAGADGKQVNTLGVEAQGDNVIFTVNGTEVARQPKAKVHADGLIGFRIGHNLDIDVDQVTR